MKYKSCTGNIIEAIQYTQQIKLIDLINFFNKDIKITIYKRDQVLVIYYNNHSDILSLGLGYYLVKYIQGLITVFSEKDFITHFSPTEHSSPDSEDHVLD